MANVVIDPVALAALVAGNAAAADVTNDWNGSAGDVDLAKPTDHTGDYGKIVAPAAGYNLRETMNYIMWVAQGKPAAAVAIEQAHIDEAIPWMRIAIARYRIYRVFHGARLVFVFRASDTVPIDFVGDAIKKSDECKQLYHHLTATPAQEDELAKVGQMLLYSLVANAIHREQNEGHSWFTTDTLNPKTPTAKALGVAGRNRETFKDFMLRYGHDINHHLSNKTLHEIAEALAKANPTMLVVGQLQYKNTNVAGHRIEDVFDLGQAVEGRYPAGILGKAGILIGLEMMSAMFSHICSRVKMSGVDGISSNISNVAKAIRDKKIDHMKLLEIGKILGPVLSAVYGFVTASNIMESDDYLAFKNHAGRHPSQIATGTSLANSLKQTRPHQQALEGAIANAVGAIAVAVQDVGSIDVIIAGAPTPIVDKVIKVDETLVQAEIGAPGGGFYNATGGP